jgi:hypothetical protein
MQKNFVLVQTMTEKELNKMVRGWGMITYVEVKSTTIDKLIRKEGFSASLTVFTRGDDGLFYELHK